MSNNLMWFGNRNHMQWVKCPEVSADYGSGGAQHSARFLNGGAFNRQTKTAAKNYRLTWSLTQTAEIRKIIDYLEGVHGEGDIYWNDPFTSHLNALPQSFATPSIGARDGVILNGGSARPATLLNSISGKSLPHEAAQFALDAATDNPVEVWIPIPPGYGFYSVFYGSATGTAGVEVSTGGTWAAATLNTPASNALGEGWVGVRLAGTGSLILSGAMVKVVPTAELSAQTDTFVSGQGHSGCDFDGYPTREMYSAAFDLAGLTAQFIEVGQWK